MAKLTLDTIAKYDEISKINNNFDKIEAELQNKVLYRNNPVGEPNTIEGDVDFNNKNVFNVNEVRASDIFIDGTSVTSSVQASQAAAAASAAAAQEASNAIGIPQKENYAEIRAYSGAVTAYYVKGHTSALDGGAGVFRVDSADTTSADNGGTILVDASGRRWKREYSGAVNVRWFGAKGDGVADDTTPIQSALNSGARDVFCPVGTYKVTATLYIPERVTLSGDARGTTIAASGIAGAAIRSYQGAWGTYKSDQHLRDITISGTCTYGVVWMGSVIGSIERVSVIATCTHGFIVDGSFGCKFESLNTNGGTISGACFWAGRDFNANHVDGLYTSNYCTYNFLSDSVGLDAITGYVSESGVTGHGTTLTNVCCQGGTIGMALFAVNPGGWTINSPYFENCVKPMQLGNGAYVCRSVTLNSLFISNVASGNPGGASVVAVDIDNAVNVTFNSPEFGGFGTATDIIHYRLSHKVQMNGFYLTNGGIGSKITDKIKHKTGADSDGGVFVIGEEVSEGGVWRTGFLLMKSQGFGYQHFKMELTGGGAWTAASVVPPAA